MHGHLVLLYDLSCRFKGTHLTKEFVEWKKVSFILVTSQLKLKDNYFYGFSDYWFNMYYNRKINLFYLSQNLLKSSADLLIFINSFC
jgi:hypothetical protein